MSKRIIAKAILNEMVLQLSADGYTYSKESSDAEMNFFQKENEDVRVVLSYSLSGRGTYSPFGSLRIIYKDLSRILFDLLEGSPFQQDYDLKNAEKVWAGVGISSEVGRHSIDKNTYSCGKEEEAREFALNYSRKIKSAEEIFVNPHLHVDLTIKEFMKPMHAFWPGALKSFLEHLVALGIKNSNPETIQYAFQKAGDVCKKLVPEAQPQEFIEILRQRVELLDFMKNLKN